MLREKVVHFEEAAAEFALRRKPSITSEGRRTVNLSTTVKGGAILPYEVCNPFPHKEVFSTISADEAEKVEVEMTGELISIRARQIGHVIIQVQPHYQNSYYPNQDYHNALFIELKIK